MTKINYCTSHNQHKMYQSLVMYGIGRELSFSYLSLAIISHTVILKAYYINKFQWTVCPHVQKETILRWVNQYFCIYIITSFIFTSYSLSLTIFVLRVTCCSDYVEVILSNTASQNKIVKCPWFSWFREIQIANCVLYWKFNTILSWTPCTFSLCHCVHLVCKKV